MKPKFEDTFLLYKKSFFFSYSGMASVTSNFWMLWIKLNNFNMHYAIGKKEKRRNTVNGTLESVAFISLKEWNVTFWYCPRFWFILRNRLIPSCDSPSSKQNSVMSLSSRQAYGKIGFLLRCLKKSANLFPSFNGGLDTKGGKRRTKFIKIRSIFNFK